MSSSESEEFFDMNTTTSMEEFFTEPPNRLKQFVLSNDVQKLKELIDRGASTWWVKNDFYDETWNTLCEAFQIIAEG